MSPRPRKVTDDEVFAAAGRVMARLGPADLTLAGIATEAGVTAGALVQRFGSKRGLLVSMSRAVAEAAAGQLADMRRQHASAIETLHAHAACLAALAPSPEALARNLAYLQLDLADAALHGQLFAQARATRRALERLVAEAVAEGHLVPGTDPRRLGRVVETALGGSLMTWATYRQRSAAEWLRRDLELVLEPYRTTRRSPRAVARTPARAGAPSPSRRRSPGSRGVQR
jgi:AcrR family transcriptional regulator